MFKKYACKSQKAPIAKRCIKTQGEAETGERVLGVVRQHRAPKGALRRGRIRPRTLRPGGMSESTERQKVH